MTTDIWKTVRNIIKSWDGIESDTWWIGVAPEWSNRPTWNLCQPIENPWEYHQIIKSSASYSDHQGAQERYNHPQHQNYQKPLGKSSNHQTMDCDLPKTVRIIIKSSNGIVSLGWYMSQGCQSGGDCRKPSQISLFDDLIWKYQMKMKMKSNWFDDLIYEIIKSSNNLIIWWFDISNHQIIWYQISYLISKFDMKWNIKSNWFDDLIYENIKISNHPIWWFDDLIYQIIKFDIKSSNWFDDLISNLMIKFW